MTSRLKPVVQQERTGCGIASAAVIAGVSYAEARKAANLLGIYASDSRLWSETLPVRRLLRHFGISIGTREIPFRSWDALPELALLSIKWHREKNRPYWHWVVFSRAGGAACVLDSRRGLRTNRRVDFGRIKPKWYIAVTRR